MKQEMHVLGIDIAKHVFHAVGMDETGKVVFRKRVSRHDLMPCIAKLPLVLIGIEACGGAHDWARRFRAYGHEVKRMAPQCVKPYVKSNTNDSRDAEAIAEAVPRPTRRFVPATDVDQQDMQALHRVRERLLSERPALVHEVHGLAARVWHGEAQRGGEVSASRGREACIRQGHAHAPEPGDGVEIG